MRGLGEDHDGSLRAENMLNEDSNANFEQLVMSGFKIGLGPSQHS